MITDYWLAQNTVELTDSFVDNGKSARTSTRLCELESFIRKHHKSVDFLLVDQFDRLAERPGRHF